MEGTNSDSSFSIYADVSVRDANGRKPSSYYYSASRLMRRLASAQEVGKRAAERALRRIGSKARPTGEYNCVIEAIGASKLADPLFFALEGSNIQQKRSFWPEKSARPLQARCST
jgi:PmbA protein